MNLLALSLLLSAGPALAQTEIPFIALGHEPSPYLQGELIRYRLDQACDELSGICSSSDRLEGAKWLTVVDGETTHPMINRLEAQGDHGLRMKEIADLSTFNGYAAYAEELVRSLHAADPRYQKFDFEGIAQCGKNRVYLVNERYRHVLEADLKKKTLRRLPIPFGQIQELQDGGPNAGFEGLAVDCDHDRLYVAKERAPRRIYAINLKTFAIEDRFDVKVSKRFQAAISEYNGLKPALTIGPDFADLAFRDGYLYALERGAYEIAKIDPGTHQVVARLSFGEIALKHPASGAEAVSVKRLYDTGEPFGLAEGLVIGRDRILIALDNNEKPLYSDTAAALGATTANGAILLEIKRPKEF